MVKISSFIILCDKYDKESDILGLLFFPYPTFLPKFRENMGTNGQFNLFKDDDDIIYKYQQFWESFINDSDKLRDFTVSGDVKDTKQTYYDGIKKINLLLIGETESIDDEDIELVSQLNSGFVNETITDDNEDGYLYTMFEYNIKDENVTIRSFVAKLMVDTYDKIITYKRTNSPPTIISQGKLEIIEVLLDSIKSDETRELEKLKFTESLEKKMKKVDEPNNDSYYLLGFTSNEDYKDSILEELKPQVPQGGGYKQKGGLTSEEVQKWGNGLIQQIKGIREQKEEEKEEEKKEEKNPPSKTMSDIAQLKEVVEQKSGNVTQQIRSILDKEHSYMGKAGKGGYTRRRKMKRGIKNITLKR